MVAVACIGVRISARHLKHFGTTEGGETVGGSSCGEMSAKASLVIPDPDWASFEKISPRGSE
jgi:hypothetical protein